ncbi:MAG: 3-oxoacyl-[acyl-carrier protein] reductase, partial [uncultured Solirubrobacteraceae bacterium]
ERRRHNGRERRRRARGGARLRAPRRRARAHRAGARPPRVGSRRGRGRWRAAGDRDRARRRRRARSRRRGDADRGAARPDRRLGQQRDVRDARVRARDGRRGLPPRHRGDAPRPGPRRPRRAETDAPARSRGDRHGRLGARLSCHPAAGELLRRQARHARVHRRAALRAHARGQRRADHVGPPPRPEHAAVRLGQDDPTAPSAAGRADLPARARRAGDRPCERASAARVLRGRLDGRDDRRQPPGATDRRSLPRPHRRRGTADRHPDRGRPARLPAPPVAGRPRVARDLRRAGGVALVRVVADQAARSDRCALGGRRGRRAGARGRRPAGV